MKKYLITYTNINNETTHEEATTQKECCEILKNKTEKNLINKTPWKKIDFYENGKIIMTLEQYGFGYHDYRPILKTIENFLFTKKWQEIWQKTCY